MNYPLVSIITPCWNGESFIHRYFDSILNQTYNNIELIFVNNGSVDKTGEIAESYKNKLERKGGKVKYIHLEKNIYTGGGINEGLKHFTGDYVMWPDSDDIMYPNHVEEKVRFLEENKEHAWAACKCRVVDETNLNKGIGTLEIKHENDAENLFERFIKRDRVYFTGMGFIFRSSRYLEVNPSRSIFFNKSGSNWQLILPIAYKYKCTFINKTLGDYVIRRNSASRFEHNIDMFDTLNDFEIILNEMIKMINPKDKQYYLDMIKHIFMKERLKIAYELKNIELLEQQYQLIKSENILTNKEKRIYYRSKFIILDILFKVMIKFRNKIRTWIRSWKK
jgi:glycosyltransferase involved in cell wall biosynthesis